VNLMANLDWPGLLKWSLKYNDGTRPSTATQMSREDVKFVEGAIREAMSSTKDPYDLVREAVPMLHDPNPAVVQTALQVIESCLDYADIARNLHKMNAVNPLLDLLWHRDEKVVDLSLDILSISLSHNPALQSDIGSKDGLNNFVLRLLQSPSDSIGAKALSCISALIRHDRSLEMKFIQSDGFKVISNAVASPNYKFQQKAASLAAHLIHERVVPYDLVCQYNFMSSVVILLGNRNLESTGIQHGEVCAQLAYAALTAYKEPLSNEGRLQEIANAVAGRLEYLRLLELRLELFDASTEIEILDDCRRILGVN